MSKSLFLWIVASVGIIATDAAQAMSCTDYKNICLSKGSKEARCAGAWKQCMRTGTYIGPDTGKNHGQADKQ